MQDRSIGQCIRELRGRLYTQRQLAERAEVSVDLVRKLEQGSRNSASVASLHRLARALDVSLADLLGRGSFPKSETNEGVTALRFAVAGVGDLLDGSEPEPLDAREAERTLSHLWGAYWDGEYEQLVSLLPPVLESLRALDSSPAAVVHGYWLAGYVLVQLRQPDAAFLAIRQAVESAERAGDPLLVATLHGTLAWQLMVSGRHAEAESLALRAAGGVEPRGRATPPALSTYGSLVLTAATAASRGRKPSRARDLVAESAEIADRLGEDRQDYRTAFGPSQVVMQTVDVGLQSEEFADALVAARKMPRMGSALPLAARARHLTDRAKAHTRLGQYGEAANLVLTAEQWAPSWARHQSLLKSVTRDLLHSRASRAPRLRSMAARIGVR
ncbi:helix-turn-helix domain-containing protein [Saccharopolyspora dendranthemae]|uniref:Helix-turn-helix protein n=1 Tax=Saccharopolyspora dendranthemae TaxID=1181886 RepID=A0A561U9W3_9PSEU|nr:helix-turn-helix transcriptional regulator [Saccharopolyspora dendranthemae]TWF96146.1 helix-turn-helix protein [Saccharopolyspora dendranthemae]